MEKHHISNQRFGDDTTPPSELLLQSQYLRCQWLAQQLGIKIEIEPIKHGLRIGFNSVSDQTRFERNAFNPRSRQGSQEHTMKFVDHPS